MVNHRIDAGKNIEEITEYRYNPEGIRVESKYEKKENGGTVEQSTKSFLIDAYNHADCDTQLVLADLFIQP